MNLPLLLFIVRLLSAGLLLAFLGLIAYTLYRDTQSVRGQIGTGRPLGTLRVLSSYGDSPAVDTGFLLRTVTSIGRSTRNTVVLDDSFVSQEHARLTRRDGHWWLDDLGSRNGTLLNDVPLTASTVVTAEDTITIGRVVMKLEPESGAVE
jgi:pSer/pThr/pTyr-binding forkhead associated (FHA) protein